ncbi:MAG: hypothetical protein ACE5F9_13710 [Phycisphaerae bacterium]
MTSSLPPVLRQQLDDKASKIEEARKNELRLRRHGLAAILGNQTRILHGHLTTDRRDGRAFAFIRLP